MAIDKKLLSEGLSALGLEGTNGLATQLAKYGEEIELWNPAYGLVGAEGRDLVVKHLLDSLAPVAAIRQVMAELAASREPDPAELAAGRAFAPLPLRLADLGTGAGLPGIPLALALPELKVTLVERMGKRVRFLENEKVILRLANVDIQESEVERAKGPFDLITFRAFRPFEKKLFKAVFALCEPDGLVLAYKGRRDKAEAELGALSGLYSSVEIRKLEVPFLDEERCLVMLRPAARA